MCKGNQRNLNQEIQSLFSKFKNYTYLSSEENMTFLQMFLITFVITICMTAVIILLVLDSDYSNPEKTGQGLRFSVFTNMDFFSYVFSSIVQTIVPTTITFSGTILILQSRSNMNRTYKVLLFISIILLALFGIMQNSVKSLVYLNFTNAVLLILIVLSLFFSKKIFNLNNSSTNKKEISDGTPIA